MQRLWSAHDIPDLVRTPFLDPMLDRGQVCGRIEISSVTFLDERWFIFKRRHVVEENALRAIALAGNAFGLKFLHQTGEAVVVETFPQVVIEMNIQAIIDSFQALERHLHTTFPDRQVLSIATLEFH